MRAMLRTAPAATNIATNAVRACVERMASAADATAYTAPNEARYRVRSAIKNSVGMTTFATGEIVITTHASPIAMQGPVRHVLQASTPGPIQTIAPSRCQIVRPVETVSSPGE